MARHRGSNAEDIHMSSDQSSIRESIVQCLREEKPSFADKFDESTPTSEIEIDSIDVIQIVFKLEDMFQVSLDIDPSIRFETIGGMLDYLEGLIVKTQQEKAKIAPNA